MDFKEDMYITWGIIVAILYFTFTIKVTIYVQLGVYLLSISFLITTMTIWYSRYSVRWVVIYSGYCLRWVYNKVSGISIQCIGVYLFYTLSVHVVSL